VLTFEGEFTVDGTPEELWPYFTDPEILQDAAPGCGSLTLHSPSEFTAALSVGVGSVKPSFDVDGVVTAAERPERLELRATGEASRNSFEASASQEFHDNGDGTTTVEWRAEAEVSGIIASLGERALGSVTNNLVEEFFRTMEDHVNSGTPAESKLRAATPEAAAAAGAADAASPDTSSAGDHLPGEVIVDAGRFDGFVRPGAYLGAGVVIGAVGATLWRWRRGERDADGGSIPSPGRRTAVLLLVALAALAAVLRGRSDDLTEFPDAESSRTAEPGMDATAETDTDTDIGIGTGAGSDEPDRETASEEVESEDGDSDDPLDRLESR
jgi:carbon monoxide dehydrogenase subunit G